MKTLKTAQPLKDLTNQDLKEGSTIITVGLIITNVLSGNVDNPYRAYQLAKKIATEKTVELNAEDVVYIKEQLTKNKQLGALCIGQAVEILESSDK